MTYAASGARKVACAMFSLFALTAESASLRVCAAEWPPFTESAAEGHAVTGILAERVRRALAAAGYEATIHVVSWERCLRDLADGYYAAAYPAAYRKERGAFAVYPAERLTSLNYVAVVRRGGAAGWRAARGIAALPQPVAVPRAWALAEELAGLPGLTLDLNSETMEQNLRKLKAGRVGAALVEARTARALLPRIDPDGSMEVLEEVAIADRPGHLILSRRALGNWGSERLAASMSAEFARRGGAER